MKTITLSIAIAALLAAGSADATGTKPKCEYGGTYPNCKPKPEPPKPEPPTPTPVTQTQDQRQDQHQQQTANGGDATSTGVGVGVGYGAGGDSTAHGGNATGGAATGGSVLGSGNSTATGGAGGRGGAGGSVGNVRSGSTSSVGDTSSSSGGNSLTGGDVSNALSNDSASTSGATSASGGNTMTGGDNAASNVANNVASADGSGNSTVHVDAADRSSTRYESQMLVLPTLQTAAPAIVAGPAMTVIPGVCGPKVTVEGVDAYGTYVGMFKRADIALGPDHLRVIPAAEPFLYRTDSRGNTYVEGDRVDYVSYTVGVAASRGLGLGGGDTGGGWGQAGVSSGSSIQRPMIRALVTPCIVTVQAPAEVPVIPARPRG